jgi:uncharacterized protein YecE (DUF72 family)
MPTKKFDAGDFEAFLKLLPDKAGKQKLRHAVEVRHDSFKAPEFVDLARKHGAAIVYAHSGEFPEIADPTADFIYARLQKTQEKIGTGYSGADLDGWTKRARVWDAGGTPKDLPLLSKAPEKTPRDCFIYFISGAKVRAPAAAMALIERLDG